MSDKGTLTNERTLLFDTDDANDTSVDKGELIIGLGEYAEIKYPKSSAKKVDIVVPPSVVTCDTPVITVESPSVTTNDNKYNQVSTFSLHRRNTHDLTNQNNSSLPTEDVVSSAVRMEYSTPWDAKSEREKIIKVMSKCPSENVVEDSVVGSGHMDVGQVIEVSTDITKIPVNICSENNNNMDDFPFPIPVEEESGAEMIGNNLCGDGFPDPMTLEEIHMNDYPSQNTDKWGNNIVVGGGYFPTHIENV